MENRQKLSVLFVDDEPAVLRMLPRLLADLQEQWRMDVAESAEKGLEMMARAPFDVLVTDLKMPGMSGQDFLKVVKDLYPMCTRIVYSSYSDQQTVLGCVGLVHQFLPKPCPKEWLEAAIQRTAIIRALVADPAMQESISKMERVLSMPSLYLQLVRQLHSVETPIADIAATVAQDVGMTAQVLRIVNSASFGLTRPTASLVEAIGFLGIDTVKYLVLAIGIFSQFETQRLGGLTVATLWQHSVRAAQAAKLIAQCESAKRELVEDALAAGLLHDLGKLVLASSFPESYEEACRNAVRRNVEWHVAEKRLLGVNHAEVGGYILGLWGLPLSVVEAVAYHHFPNRSKQTEFSALTAVHAANVLVLAEGGSSGGVPPPQVDRAYLTKIGRANALESWKLELAAAPARP
ncbi:MAG: HDOD domain-containing protein [Verrucomicrobia bacterium]|nr:HDOD domain-containing protein [Verrucomicrobiota bacterium]